MKLIHCADLHLDSKMNANFDQEQAKERRSELLHTFERMVEYASNHQIAAILIAGDLFDTRNISATTRNVVMHSIVTHPQINFYYLKGNHDKDNFLSGVEELPSNLKLFSSTWTTYEEAGGKVSISGLELSTENQESAYHSLVLDARKFNIVMLHGQEAESTGKDDTEKINLKQLKNKGIDYLALGHIHTYKAERLDARGIYCYAGCLEGRGFDECGEHGFVVLDIEETTGTYTQKFVPFAQRTLYTVEVDVTGCQTTIELAEKASAKLQETGGGKESLVKLVLKGKLDVECEKNSSYLLAGLKQSFYFVKISDETTLSIDSKKDLYEISLRGEYLRQVLQDSSIADEDKTSIIRYGLQALAGEEIQ